MQIIYEDDDVFAAVKPAGVVMHADSHHPKGSFLEMVCTLRPTAQLLHRLDKDTSGVALFAKTDAAASYYKKLFKDTLIQKTYLALVVGTFTKKKGIIALQSIYLTEKGILKIKESSKKVIDSYANLWAENNLQRIFSP